MERAEGSSPKKLRGPNSIGPLFIIGASFRPGFRLTVLRHQCFWNDFKRTSCVRCAHLQGFWALEFGVQRDRVLWASIAAE
jgi:hypothetical protein